MRDYQHIYFDLDHTLWDFNTNCRITLDELYDRHNFSTLEFSKEDFYKHYKIINDSMWEGYHKGKVTKEEIRSKRFEFTFKELGLPKDKIPSTLEHEFLSLCPTKGQLFPYAHESLKYLLDKGYFLHIITNGFKETQQIKLATSGLSPYFNHVVESDVCGFMKPDKRIFDYALSLSKANASSAIMIGDDLHADILGAKNAGIAQIYFNRYNTPHQEILTHEIDCLSTLQKLL